MKTFTTKEIGSLGEQIAAKYLRNKGYTILSFNYWKPYGEIDVIARKDRIIHFLEVKTVSCEIDAAVTHENIWNPGEKINAEKIRKMVRTVDTYVQEKGIENDWQMDALLVQVDIVHKKAKVELIENISPYT